MIDKSFYYSSENIRCAYCGHIGSISSFGINEKEIFDDRIVGHCPNSKCGCIVYARRGNGSYKSHRLVSSGEESIL